MDMILTKEKVLNRLKDYKPEAAEQNSRYSKFREEFKDVFEQAFENTRK